MVCCEKNRADCDMINPIAVFNIILVLLGICCCLPIGIWCFFCRWYTDNALKGSSGREPDAKKKATQKMKNVLGATQSMKKAVEVKKGNEGETQSGLYGEQNADAAAAAPAAAAGDGT